MALVTAMISYARSQDSLLSASTRGVHDVFSTTGFEAEESCIMRHVKHFEDRQPLFGEASSKPRALSWDRTQAIGAPVYGFNG